MSALYMSSSGGCEGITSKARQAGNAQAAKGTRVVVKASQGTGAHDGTTSHVLLSHPNRRKKDPSMYHPKTSEHRLSNPPITRRLTRSNTGPAAMPCKGLANSNSILIDTSVASFCVSVDADVMAAGLSAHSVDNVRNMVESAAVACV